MQYELLFIFSLVFTILIELIVLFLLLRYAFHIGPKHISTSLVIFAGIFASFATLPYLWFVLPAFIQTRLAWSLIGECSVFLVEAIFYKFTLKTTLRQSLFLSFCCNLASFVLGLFIFAP